MRGALANLSAPAASRIAGELESMAMAGDITSAGSKLAELEEELARVIGILENLCLETVR